MGIRCSFTMLPASTIQSVVAGEQPSLAGEIVRIDSAWDEFHALLRDKPWPLNLAIAGDVLSPRHPVTLYEFLDGKHDFFCGFASPALVAQIDGALKDLGVEDYRKWQTERFGEPIDYFADRFAVLQQVYAKAARDGCGLVILIV